MAKDEMMDGMMSSGKPMFKAQDSYFMNMNDENKMVHNASNMMMDHGNMKMTMTKSDMAKMKSKASEGEDYMD